jgi:hypothetical protein
VKYRSYATTLWQIDYYTMYYSRSGSISTGCQNNENPAKVRQGYEGGMSTFGSADSGCYGTWLSRTGYGTTYTYKGQTVFGADAYADVTSIPDPDLYIHTAVW